MKTLLKILSAVLVVVLILGAVWYFTQESKECCLCNSFRYHAPCLIDLETGDIIELDIYFPHKTMVAELANPQPKQDTFSFIRVGNASGYIDTAQERITLEIPLADKTYNPALCKNCRKKIDAFHTGRYVLADLYAKPDDREKQKLIPITDGMHIELRCYSICANKNRDESIDLIIQGTLE